MCPTKHAHLSAPPQVVSLLESIPKMFAASQVQETCGGAALRSAVEALKGGEGGRLHAFLCSLPRRGAMHLRLRDIGRPPTDRDTLDSMLPESKEYAALAADAAEHQVSVDLFLLAQGYVDVATLGVLSAHTAGSLHHWAPWTPALDADEFFNDLRWAVVRPQVGLGAVRIAGACGGWLRVGVGQVAGPGMPWPAASACTAVCGLPRCVAAARAPPASASAPGPEVPSSPEVQGLEAVGRLRVSRGLAVEKYIGAFYRRVDTDLNFPALSCDHSVAAKLVYEVRAVVGRRGWPTPPQRCLGHRCR